MTLFTLFLICALVLNVALAEDMVDAALDLPPRNRAKNYKGEWKKTAKRRIKI